MLQSREVIKESTFEECTSLYSWGVIFIHNHDFEEEVVPNQNKEQYL